MRVALLDGDIIAYRAASAVQEEIEWEDGKSVHANVSESVSAALQTVKTWMKIADVKDCRIAFTGKDNFRKLILPTYKANRSGRVKPVAFQPTVEALSEHYPTRLVRCLEGDDLIGIMATNGNYKEPIIMSVDKDMRTIPGWHMNPLKDPDPVYVTEEHADSTGCSRRSLATLRMDTRGYLG